MNTVGKILVILNLVFALITGGFLVIDFATRTNWKNAYEALKRDVDVNVASSGQTAATFANLTNQVAKRDAEIEKLKEDNTVLLNNHKVEMTELKLQRDEAVDKITQADLNAKKAQAEVARMKTESQDLVATIAQREQEIAKLHGDNKTLRTEAINKEIQAKSSQDRNEVLLEDHQRVLKELAKYKSGATATTETIVPAANQPNVPSTSMRGKIVTVDARDKNLVKVSLGSDDGLQRNHTLDVYRMSPNPQYLGMIRIVETGHHESVGRLMSSTVSGARAALREGDIVASSLNP